VLNFHNDLTFFVPRFDLRPQPFLRAVVKRKEKEEGDMVMGSCSYGVNSLLVLWRTIHSTRHCLMLSLLLSQGTRPLPMTCCQGQSIKRRRRISLLYWRT
jgi:hypothetical protein